MRAYSEDLRQKIVAAIEQREMPKAHVARLFGVSLSSVKRYARIARQGDSLAPKKGSGRPPKVDEDTEKLLEAQTSKNARPRNPVEQRRRFLERLTAKTLSDSTVRRLLLRRMGFTAEKKDCGGDGKGRMAKGCLAGDGS